MPYPLLLQAHSIFRWLVILALVWVLLRYWSGLLSKSEHTPKDRAAGLIFTTLLNVQFLLGIILYFTSPIIKSGLADFGAAMKTPMLRFFLVEHPAMMFLAVVIAQVGFSLAKRAATDRAKFLKGTIAYTIAAVLILASVPWPFFKAYGRPLFPAIGG